MRLYIIGFPVCFIVCLLLSPSYPGSTVPANTGPEISADGGRDISSEAVAFLEKCIAKYDREVKGVSLVMRKQERIDGKLQQVEIIEVYNKERPHSVFFQWTQGARKAERALFVEGENDGKLLALPAGPLKLVGVQARDLDSDDAKQSGRYTIAEFGLKKAMDRVLKNWKKADAEKTLFVERFDDQRVPETGDRLCYKLRRSKFAQPEDGITELTLFIDTETLLQVGSVLRDKDGGLIAEYYFREIRLNPEFKKDQFTRAALAAK